MKTLRPDDLGKKIMVENCQKVTIGEIIKKANESIKEELLMLQVQAISTNINITTSLTHRGGKRYWFLCPICIKRVGVLFIHPITQKVGCRECLDLKYQKSRFKGMIEGAQ